MGVKADGRLLSPLLESVAVGTSRACQESCDKEFAMKDTAKVPR